jgi:type II secretory pathway predicted ATPase ExeA
VIERLQAHYGFTRVPFGRDLAPCMLHRHNGHAEAVARIAWCVDQRTLGVVTGEVGAGKTVAVRAALSSLDTSRHSVIYLPNPAVGARGIHHAIVTALGGVPRFHHATLIPQAAGHLAAEIAERGRLPVLLIDFSDRPCPCPRRPASLLLAA